MGMFSGITKMVKKVFKGVGKVFKAVGSAVKSFVQSKLGRIVLIGAAIWLGGAAIGMWNSGFASIDGALVATQAGAAAPAAAEAATVGAGTATTQGAAAAATGGLSGAAPAVGSPFTAAAPGTVAGVSGGGFMSAAAPVAGSPFTMAAPVVAAAPPPVAGPGFMKTAGKVVSGATKWIEAHPNVALAGALVGGPMLANAFTPNAIDVAEDEARRRQEEIDAANARLAGVGGVPTWQYSGAKLPPPQPPVTRPAGIMGRRLV